MFAQTDLMTRRSLAARYLAAVALLIASMVLVVGCSSAQSAPTTSASSSTATAAVATGTEYVVTTQLTSAANDLTRLGPNDEHLFGWNLLVGTGTFQGQPVDVRLQGSVNYTNGNGPFGDFLQLIASDGSRIAFSVQGQATQTDISQLDADLTFIGSSGAFAGLSGNGIFRATRTAEVGAPVETTITLNLTSS